MLCPNTQAVTNGYAAGSAGFVDGENGKKVYEKGNNIGSCPFLPMTRQNTDLGMVKCEKHLSEKCEKQIFVLTSF